LASEDRRRTLRDTLDELDRFFEELEKDIEQNVRSSLDGAKKFAKPFVTGFSMKMDQEGKPTLEMFGDSPQAAEGSRVPISEQILDLKNGRLSVVFEMPGVDKQEIDVAAADDRLVVKSDRAQRKYRAEVELKSPIDEKTGVAKYRNGILEVSFSLRDKANKGYRRVDID
jgi:HSP20 family protein